jgi:hypothetical protein
MAPYGARSLSGYDTAQVCLNGHVITQFAQSRPEHTKKFCDRCGAATILDCPKCSKRIQGYHHHPRVGSIVRKEPPAFCHECGHGFPWTAQRIAAANQLANEEGNFSAEEREEFQASLNDIVKQVPGTPIAVGRIKKLIAKSGQVVSNGLRDILVDVLSEAVKKQIWG